MELLQAATGSKEGQPVAVQPEVPAPLAVNGKTTAVGRSQVASKLQEMVHNMFGFDVPATQPLMEAGLDSLSAAELRNTISTAFQAELPATVMFDYPTLDALTNYVTEHLAPSSRRGLPPHVVPFLWRGHVRLICNGLSRR